MIRLMPPLVDAIPDDHGLGGAGMLVFFQPRLPGR